jgi:hypothetical protein
MEAYYGATEKAHTGVMEATMVQQRRLILE